VDADNQQGTENARETATNSRLQGARKQFTPLRLTYGLIGIAAAAVEVAAVYRSIHVQSAQAVVLTTILVVVGMVLMWVLSRTVGRQKKGIAESVLIWASIVFFVVCVTLTLTLSTRREPQYLADVLGLPRPYQRPTDEEARIVRSIISMGLPRPDQAPDPSVHDTQRSAQQFIDQNLKAWCDRTHDAACFQVGVTAVEHPINTAELPSAARITITPAPSRGSDPCADIALAKGEPPPKIYGLSVSHHNMAIDWANLRSRGYFFVSIKATQGGQFQDPEFATNWADAGRAGFVRTAYHFLTGDVSGERQAALFLTTVAGVEVGPCDLPPTLDFESNPQGAEATLAQAMAWLASVRAAVGKRPIVYAGHTLRDFGAAVPRDLWQHPLWWAAYRPTLDRPYAFWEFTDGAAGTQGPVSRISSSVFNGDREQLFALASLRN
jgi:lysozyme